MRRSKTARSRPRTSIMDLSYTIHHDLSKILDPSGANDWKNLVSLMPSYTAKDVKLIETEGNKPGMSCTKHLLQDMDNRGYNMDDLREALSMSGNEKALKCLLEGLDDIEALIHEDTKTNRKRKRRIRSTMELEEPSDLQNEDTKNRTQISGTEHQNNIHRSARKTGLTSRDDGTRGTLMDRSIHQPTDKTDLGSSIEETNGTLTMDQPIHQPARKIGLTSLDEGTRGTLIMERSIHREPTGETDLGSLHERTLDTSKMNHHHDIELIELNFPIQETTGLKKETHKRRHIENWPSENDESPYREAYGHKRSMQCLPTLNYERLAAEHEDNKHRSTTTCDPAPLFQSFFTWMMSCGSQVR